MGALSSSVSHFQLRSGLWLSFMIFKVEMAYFDSCLKLPRKVMLFNQQVKEFILKKVYNVSVKGIDAAVHFKWERVREYFP